VVATSATPTFFANRLREAVGAAKRREVLRTKCLEESRAVYTDDSVVSDGRNSMRITNGI
jgi:hypothetical protein